ncbi:MAG: hypothetical protein WBW32_08920 [Luteibacter sp.]
MSFDLALFAHYSGVTDDEVREAYRAYCEGTKADLAEVSPVLAGFVQALEARYPQLQTLTDDEVDSSPWSCDFDQGPTHLILSMVFSRCVEVGEFIGELLKQFPLILYDPQGDEAYFGDNRLPSPAQIAKRPWWKVWG